MWQLSVNNLREHKYSYLLTYLLTYFYFVTFQICSFIFLIKDYKK